MEFIYEKVLAQLATIPEIKYCDLDKGQMETEYPSVSFPAALINMQLPRCEDLGAKRQKCQALISIRLCFNFSGNTNSKTPELERQKSFAYFELAEKVYQAFQGFKDENINAFSRQNMREERRPDKYKVVVITFSTSFIDKSAV